MRVLSARGAVPTGLLDVVLLPVFVLSHLFPRTDRIEVYGYSDGTSFTDNSKYQYLHAQRTDPDRRAVWLTRTDAVAVELREAGHEVHRFRSVRGVYLTLRAGVVYVTHSRRDVPWFATGGADVVRLGHGIPFKKYGRADPGYEDRKGLKRRGYELTVGNYAATIATSETFAPYVGEATGLPPESVHVTGLPRMDMPGVPAAERELYADGELLRRLRTELVDSRIVFYFPTWRDGDASPVPPDLDLEALAETLRATDSYLLTRPHPNSANWGLDASGLDRVIELDTDADLYPVFEHVDLFVTDYSSLFHDAVYFDVPVLFLAHDLAAYTERRAFFFEYEAVPGDVVRTADAFEARLRDALADLDAYEDDHAAALEDWRGRTFAFRDDRNCERVDRAVRAGGLETG